MKNILVAATIIILVLVMGCATTKPAQKPEIKEEPVEPQAPVEDKKTPVSREAKTSKDVQQETMEKGGNLKDWKQTLLSETGSNSEEYQTLAECEALMSKKINECSKHPGWSVDNAMEITDFRTDKHYEFQDIKRQDCPDTEPGDKPPYTVHTDTAFLDAQTDNTRASSYQVVCSINCQWWECEEKIDLSGIWHGDYSETSGSSYCQFKESGTKTFEVEMVDETNFRGKVKFNGVAVVTGGEHCEGWSNSGEGALEGSVSGNEISGTMTYHSTLVIPFKATVNKDSIEGTYSYKDTSYGSLHSANGNFKITKNA